MTTGLVIDILPESEAWTDLGDWESAFGRAAAATLDHARITTLPGAELSVLLSDDAHVRALNRAWRGKDQATNVLSFPAVGPDRLASAPALGDIAMALETIRAEAARDEKTLGDHVVHLFVHGLLHILGYDHDHAAAAEAMEALEIRILADLGIADPYAGADLLSTMAETS